MFSKKTKRDNAQKSMYSLSKLIYIINNLVAEWYFHSYFVFQIKIKIPLLNFRNLMNRIHLSLLADVVKLIVFLCKLFQRRIEITKTNS